MDCSQYLCQLLVVVGGIKFVNLLHFICWENLVKIQRFP